MGEGWEIRLTKSIVVALMAVLLSRLAYPQEGESAPAEGMTTLPGLAPSNAARPREGEVATQPVYLDFEAVELGEIIKSIGAMTGKNFLFDPQLASTPVTLISHGPIDPQMLLPLLQSILVTYGFTMRETLDGNLIKIRLLAEEGEKTKVYTGTLELPGGYEEFSTHVVPVRYATAEDLAQLLPRLGSNNGRVDAYGPTNTLILTDNAHGIRNMLTFLQQIDVEGAEIVMEVFPLQYARAEVLATMIQDILLGTGGPGAPAAPGAPPVPRPVRPPTRPGIPGQPQQTIIGAEAPELRIVADERLNTLIVMAQETLMEKVRELIEELDAPIAYEMHNLHVYPLQHADVEKVMEGLSPITGMAPRQAGGGGPGGQPAGGGPTAAVQPFEKEVVIQAYEPTNSLVIVASPQDYNVLKELIAQLDVPQRQVHVEAIVMEVTIQNRYQLSTELTALTAEDAFALNNVVSLANILAGGPFAPIEGAVTTAGVLDGLMQIPVPGPEGAITIQAIPKIPLFLNALDDITDADVLSQPILTTVDNEEAEITIGQEVPVVMGTSTSLDQPAVGRSIFSQVQRVDTGVKLMVVPQISEGDYVLLELEVELSEPIESTIGADPNIVGPTFTKSLVKNKIVVRDGSTGVVGGLIRENTDRSRQQAPFLGDLPVVGWLFGRRSDVRGKRNLVVLVTPHIIKEGIDADRIREYRLREFAMANLDVLFEKGYIRKVKKRHYMRTKYRPSAVKMEELMEGSRFERGDVEEAEP